MDSVQKQLGLDNEAYAKFKLFNRILISYNDFKQAHESSATLIDMNLYENYPQENRQLVIALNMAAIVSYARPFLDSRGELAYNRLPGRVLRILNAEESEVHNITINARNKVMAHSDADANKSIPLVMDLGHRSIVVPVNASPHAVPLKLVTMKVLCAMSYKLQEHCFELRQEMEPELLDILPKINDKP
ncbi:MAG: hypothetical protein ABW176_05810 [Candidatus Thiodiazotropha endolucinida]